MYVCVTTFMYVCETTFMYVCETTFMYMWDYIYVCVKDMLICERYVNLWTICTTTLSDEEMIKIKVVDLDELYNFGIHHFFSWNHLMVENHVRTCHFFKFENLKCSNFVKPDFQTLNDFSCKGDEYKSCITRKISYF